MAKLNKKEVHAFEGKTHGGAPARSHTAAQELKRSVMSCLLWEDTFYESGKSIAERIADLIPSVYPDVVAQIAKDARDKSYLRHVPLLIVREMCRHKDYRPYVRATLNHVIQRADELTEFLAIYWKDGKKPIPAQVKKGLADAFTKFSAYSLAKYNQDATIKLRDVLFMVHARPKDQEQAATWKKLVDNTLESPDTWEVAISATKGKDKGDEWTRLLSEKKLGPMALLRNLRNMEQAGVDAKLIRQGLAECKAEKILPFRVLAAAKAAPKFEDEINSLMLSCCSQIEKLPGETILIVDVSGSMYGGKVSAKSDMDRAQAACALAALVRETCESADIYATAGSDYARKHQTERVPNRRGIPLIDAIYKMCHPLGGGGIFMKQVLDWVWRERKEKPADRVIVITDEQDCDINAAKDKMTFRQIAPKQYIVNVNSYKNGIGYGPWVQIDGWSDRVVDFIRELERSDN
jgi:60 kDa SS-A/Ro ribonucleoprotein